GALGVAGPAETLTWSLGLVAGALALTFAVHASLVLTLVLVLVAGVVALPFAARRRPAVQRSSGLVALAGLVFGIAVWSIEGVIRGDALFHLGRMRKLGDFGGLTLRGVGEFEDGTLQPGYTVPVSRAWLALVGKVTGLDPTQVVRHESSLLAPLAFVLA